MNTPPQNTFIVRFWWEATEASEPTLPPHKHWRGHVEHIQSGNVRHFRHIEDLLGFIEEFLGPPAFPHPPPPEET
ncbi:MAG: hypothetical protein D6803_07020 [Anaerolineae bacterium]|nr:MAG: hypothetical protein D6803_07020 [Anaerolineae bacterium]